MSTDQRYLEANQAGQAATLATVQAVTGQKIDHFAEVNLAGFYYLAGAFGGIEACIKPSNGGQNLTDANSGFNAMLDGYNLKKGGAQYLQTEGAAGAGVRPGAGQPAQRRPGPHAPAAGGTRLRDLEA